MKFRISHFLRIQLILIALLALTSQGHAAVPNWIPASGMQYNHVAYGKVFENAIQFDAPGSILGAFGPGGETDCRAVANVPLNATISYYLTITGMTNGETITFKLYDQGNDVVRDVSETIIFQSDATSPLFSLNLTPIAVTTTSTSTTTTVPPTTTSTTTTTLSPLSGRLTLGAVTGATVFADHLTGAEANHNIDTTPEDESGSVTKTDNNGNFSLNQPNYNYILVSIGGKDMISGLPAMQMLAPAGAANITPFTTMVAMNPQAQAAIESLGISYDADIAVEITPAAAVVVQSIQATVTAVSNAVSTDANPMSSTALNDIQLEVMSQVAAAIQTPAAGGAAGLTDPATLATTLGTAVTNTLATPTVTDAVTITTPTDVTNAVNTLVTSVATSIVETAGASTTGAVSEDSIVTTNIVITSNTAINTATTSAASSGITVTPAAVNHPPTISIDNQGTYLHTVANTQYTLAPSVSDPDNDSLTFGATGLPVGIGLNYGSGVLSGTPTTAGAYPISMTVSDGVVEVPVSFTLVVDSPSGQITNTMALLEGWNLVSCMVEVNAKAVFGDASTYTSIWKWLESKWAVYLPGNIDGGQGYAISKGFDLLATITPGEGFWLNSHASMVDISGTLVEGPLSLVTGWNLLGLKTNQTLYVSGLNPDEKSLIVSLWKWEDGKWAVSLPSNADDGGQAYATSKGFALLTSIKQGEGFWVNATGGMTLP